MSAFCSTNEVDIKYEPLPSEYLDGPSADTSNSTNAVVNDDARCTVSEPATTCQIFVKDEPMELPVINETLHPIEEVYCTQNVKPELLCPKLPPSELDPLNDTNDRVAKSEPGGFEYHDCKPLAFVSLNNFECSRCHRTFTQSQRLQLHLLECRDKEAVAANEPPASVVDSRATNDGVPVLSILEQRLTERRVRPCPSAADLRQVIDRIALNHRHRAPSPLDFVPQPHACFCGLTFASDHFLKLHERNVHKGKPPEFNCHGLGFEADGQSSQGSRSLQTQDGLNLESGRADFVDAAGLGSATDVHLSGVTTNQAFVEGFPSVVDRGAFGVGLGTGNSSGLANSAEFGNVTDLLQAQNAYNQLQAALKRVRDENFNKRMEAIFEAVLQQGASEPEFECSVCSTTFTSPEFCNYHYEQYHAEKPKLKFPCRYCDIEFMSLSSRNSHIKTVHEKVSIVTPDSYDFDSLLRMHNFDHAKQRRGRDKIPRNVVDSSESGTATAFEDLIKSQNVVHESHEDSSMECSTTVEAETNLPVEETPNSAESQTSPMVAYDFISSRGATNDKVKGIGVSVEDKDPLETPLCTITLDSPTSTEIAEEPDGNFVAKPSLSRSSSSASQNNISDSANTSDAEGSIVPLTIVEKAINSVSGGSKPSKVIVKPNVGKNPKILPAKIADAKNLTAVSKQSNLNSAELPIGKKTRQSAARADSQKSTAVVSDASQSVGTAKSRKDLVSNVPPSSLAMKPTTLPSTTAATPYLRSGARPLQKVIYIDIEGNINAMMTEDENPSPDPLYLCNICDTWFKGSKELLDHKTEKHMPKPTVKCSRCPELFLTDHLAACHAQVAHRAEIKLERDKVAAEQRKKLFAKFWAASERRLKREKKEARKRGEKFWGSNNDRQGHYLCLICDKYFTTKVILLKHNVDVHKKGDYICDMCGNLYISMNGLEVHQRTCSKPTTMTSKISCTICKKELLSTSKMRAHLARVHSNVREFECEVCKKRFNQFYNLRFHIKTQHNGERKYHTCLKCGKVFTALNSVRLHDISAHQSIDCNLCEATVIGKAELREHILAVHRKSTGNKFPCKSCSRTFFTKNGLSHHTSTEHGFPDKAPPKKAAPEKELIFCDICGKAYVVKSSMVRHMAVKHGFVEQKAGKKAEMRKHSLAGEEFADEGLDGTKRLKSTEEDSAADNSTSAEHDFRDKAPPKKAAPKKELLFCDICGIAYVVKSSMERHMMTKHGFVEANFVDVQGGNDPEKRVGEKSADEGFFETKKFKSAEEGSVAEIGVDSAVKLAIADEAVQSSGAENTIFKETVENSTISITDAPKMNCSGTENAVIEGTVEKGPISTTHKSENEDSCTENAIIEETVKKGPISTTHKRQKEDSGAKNAVIGGPVKKGLISKSNKRRKKGEKEPFEEEWFKGKYKGMYSRRSSRERKKVSTLLEESNLDFMVHMIDKVCKTKK